MGADNWGTCPKCEDRYRAVWERWKKDAADSYGKVEPAKYLEMLKASDSGPDWDKESFREDYSAGMYKDGFFRVNYRGSCTVCDFAVDYKFEKLEYAVDTPSDKEPK